MSTTSSSTLPDILQSLIDGVPGLAVALAALAGALGLGLAGFSLVKIYRAVQNGDDNLGGWLVAGLAGAGLTILGIVVARMSLLVVG